jgi:hypothetical protein
MGKIPYPPLSMGILSCKQGNLGKIANKKAHKSTPERRAYQKKSEIS